VEFGPKARHAKDCTSSGRRTAEQAECPSLEFVNILTVVGCELSSRCRSHPVHDVDRGDHTEAASAEAHRCCLRRDACAAALSLFDHLVGRVIDDLGIRQAEHRGRFEIDNQVNCWTGKVAGFSPMGASGVATRHHKLAANYLAFVQLASVRIWLRASKSTP
jgi:transposase